jgi:hypothetical protein
VLGNIDCRAAIFAAKREALNEPQRNQHDRCHDAASSEAREHANEERPDAHQRYGDKERVFPADQVAKMAEDRRAERPHREACGEREQREDEADIRRHVGEEVFRQERAERAIDIKIVPLEHRPER